jgi:hypothetical protein
VNSSMTLSTPPAALSGSGGCRDKTNDAPAGSASIPEGFLGGLDLCKTWTQKARVLWGLASTRPSGDYSRHVPASAVVDVLANSSGVALRILRGAVLAKLDRQQLRPAKFHLHLSRNWPPNGCGTRLMSQFSPSRERAGCLPARSHQIDECNRAS